MPRHPRVHLNGILHIVQRGHNREPCFFDEEDYDTYLHDGEALKETRCSLHACCDHKEQNGKDNRYLLEPSEPRQ